MSFLSFFGLEKRDRTAIQEFGETLAEVQDQMKALNIPANAVIQDDLETITVKIEVSKKAARDIGYEEGLRLIREADEDMKKAKATLDKFAPDKMKWGVDEFLKLKNHAQSAEFADEIARLQKVFTA